MKLSTTLAAVLMAGSVSLPAGSAVAAPIAQSKVLTIADTATVEQVQYRRWRNGRWIGPAAGIAGGVAIGSAIVGSQVYGDGYYAYGAAPGTVGPSVGYRETFRSADPGSPGPGSSSHCLGDRENNSAYPSWMCR